MHKNVTRSERAIVVAVLTLAGGCQLAQMQVSAPLDAVPALPVEPLVRKWSAPIRFGAWHTVPRPGEAQAGHNRPQVRIAMSLTPLERHRVAAVLATLLLYRSLQDQLETEQSR